MAVYNHQEYEDMCYRIQELKRSGLMREDLYRLRDVARDIEARIAKGIIHKDDIGLWGQIVEYIYELISNNVKRSS